MLPIIPPPFKTGLARILLFGLSGMVSQFVADLFGPQPTRWLNGVPGVPIAQTLALTPIAVLILIGVVEGVSPSMEGGPDEACQSLRAILRPLVRPRCSVPASGGSDLG